MNRLNSIFLLAYNKYGYKWVYNNRKCSRISKVCNTKIAKAKQSMNQGQYQPTSQRKMGRHNQHNEHKKYINQIIHQRSSQTLFLNLLKNITILFVVMSVLSVPVWVMNGIAFSKYRQNLKLADQDVSLIDYINLGSIMHTHHCINRDISVANVQQFYECEIDRKNQDSLLEFASTKLQSLFTPQGKFNRQILKPTSSYLYYCFYIDIGLQIVFLIGCGIIQYLSYRTKQQLKGNHIEDYTIEVSGISIDRPYIILPKIQQFLISNIKQRYGHDAQIFDITSTHAQLLNTKNLLESKLNFKINEQADIDTESIEGNIKSFSNQDAETDVLWITFESKYSKYLAMRLLSKHPEILENQRLAPQPIEVEKAPHPSQIIWKNIHVSQYLTLLSQILSDLFCLGILLAFDLLILYVHKSPYAILASVVILVLQMILKTVIIEICQFQKHRYVSFLNSSTSQKLTFFLYLNTALIVFISCYDFGDNFFGNTFSTRQHKRFQLKWFKTIGLNVILGFNIQLIYVTIRPGIEVVKDRIFNKLYPIYQKIKHKIKKIQFDPKQYQSKSILLKAQLDICYAHIVSVIMFANTYSFTHQILFPLAAMFTFLAYYSHKNYIAHFTQPVSFNNNNLNKNAIKYIYFSIVVHLNLSVIGYGLFEALILEVIIIFILLIKYTLVAKASKMMRKKNGPLCISKFQEAYKCKKHLKNILTIDQLNEQIICYNDKIKKYTYIYDSQFKEENFIQKYKLQQYIKIIQDKIKHLEQLKQQKRSSQQLLKQILIQFLPKKEENPQHQTELNVDESKQKSYKQNNKEKEKQESRQVKGIIVYSLSQDYFNY